MNDNAKKYNGTKQGLSSLLLTGPFIYCTTFFLCKVSCVLNSIDSCWRCHAFVNTFLLNSLTIEVKVFIFT